MVNAVSNVSTGVTAATRELIVEISESICVENITEEDALVVMCETFRDENQTVPYNASGGEMFVDCSKLYAECALMLNMNAYCGFFELVVDEVELCYIPVSDVDNASAVCNTTEVTIYNGTSAPPWDLEILPGGNCSIVTNLCWEVHMPPPGNPDDLAILATLHYSVTHISSRRRDIYFQEIPHHGQLLYIVEESPPLEQLDF